ncbi:MAG: Exopolysaccharide phosphotransferase CpsY [Candidatus Ordinivivax streblomastigis]|uniref:Exopolysaccharide phosphotransferase CpsY n=1 Tax=Candidatus Ordinivivax streblomastigis TaxID=2540710 RepID=A0A5M8P5K5_9BACT|nr:MAG: Exopolysaccharide phosphotransferase CpsY [Candidatus Ordinivivax streblomastigis]
MEIDLVYLWVDGNDEKWLTKKNASLGKDILNTQSNCKGRYANNDELKYSLRSVEKFAPWIRKIFIVTDNQTPDWLNLSHPKIKIIDHTEILPPESLPCFNSVIIEYFLYKIHGLSEHFLYANDDMFFNAKSSPDFFFAKDEFPVMRLKRKSLGKWSYRLEKLVKKELSIHKQTLVNASELIENQFRKSYSAIPHHNMDAYLKNDYQFVTEQLIKENNANFFLNHLRSRQDIQRVVFSYYALATGRGHLRYVNQKESCVVRLQRENYQHYFDRYHPKLVCMEDSERVSDNDRERAKMFMKNLFPTKSSFEK